MMSTDLSRRKFISTSAISASLAAFAAQTNTSARAAQVYKGRGRPLRLGLMTHTLAKDWDIDTIIENCRETKFEHAELRTTHAHRVEVSLTKTQRKEVRKKFEDAGIKISLASAFMYHLEDQKIVRENIEGTKAYSVLAHDIGAIGIRVFANAILVDKGIPEEKTLKQIGKALAEVGEFAHDYGVEIRISNHGKGTGDVARIKKIIDYSGSKHVYMNWNCDKTDIEGVGFRAKFNMVKDRIRNLHIHDLTNEKYPYRRLFALLRNSGYRGYCDAEIKASPEPIRLMRYYRALFLALQNVY
ncbi:MAG: sugar phosphate isomerase/epimerase family protein [Planctomycetota bacterium]